MIRPLDMQVNLNAIPEVARQTTSGEASVAYRQVQMLGQARIENLNRPEVVNEVASRNNPTFAPIGRDDRKSYVVRKSRARPDEDPSEDSFRPYAPISMERDRLKPVVPTGLHFDAVA